MNIQEVNEELKSIIRLMDTELLLSIAIQSNLIRKNKFEGKNLLEEADNIIFEVSKSLIKDRYQCMIRKNKKGFSVAIPYSENFSQVYSLFRRTLNQNLRNWNTEISSFYNQINNVSSSFFNRNTSLIFSEDRFLFYFNYEVPNFYPSKLVYSSIFNMFLIIEELEQKFDLIPRIEELIQQYDVHIQEQRLREEEEQRRREEEERRRREEERRRIEEEERRRREEEERVRQENERRQNLIRQGATRGGIEIAARLQELLNNRR